MIHVYQNPDVSSFQALYQALVALGDSAAEITLNGTLKITTSLSKAECDAAVDSAKTNTLHSDKTNKIIEIQAKTKELLELGVDTWVSGQMAELTKPKADEYYTDFEYFNNHAGQLTSESPYIVFTLQGRSIETSDLNDIETLSDNAVARLKYLYVNTVNNNSSKGELQLIKDVLAAQNKAELDSITDTRV